MPSFTLSQAVIRDRVKELSSTTGTSSFVLLGAEQGCQTFDAVGNGVGTFYGASNADLSEWEVGAGIYNSVTRTLTRDSTAVQASSNSGALVSFSAGTKYVFCASPAYLSNLIAALASAISVTTSSTAVVLSNTGASFVGGLAVGGATAATSGVAFPATAVAVANVNTLDDYEEGTFTPTIGSIGGGTPTYGARFGAYTKVGRQVTFRLYLVWTAYSGGGGNMSVGGLPFSDTFDNTYGLCNVSLGGVAYTAGASLYGSVSGPTVALLQATNGGAMFTPVTLVTSGTVQCSGSYFV